MYETIDVRVLVRTQGLTNPVPFFDGLAQRRSSRPSPGQSSPAAFFERTLPSPSARRRLRSSGPVWLRLARSGGLWPVGRGHCRAGARTRAALGQDLVDPEVDETGLDLQFVNEFGDRLLVSHVPAQRTHHISLKRL